MARATAKAELRPGSLVARKYRLERQLGRGAAGIVWAAVNTATSRKVALKLLLDPGPRASERLLREARAAGALAHPNVVDVYDVIVTEDGSPALVLELLQGKTLHDLICERAPLPQHEAAAIGRDVARALAVAHASGIVHRDLKPANIFLHHPDGGECVVKVVDFGISKNLLTHERTLTQTGMAVGSPPFMSPEQVSGEVEVDGRADLWALGVILYELLADVRLFEGRPHEVLRQVLHRPIKPIGDVVPGLDPAFGRVVDGLLERDLKKRTASADDVAGWLSAIADSALERLQRPTVPASRGGDTAALPVISRPLVLPDLSDHEGEEDEDDDEDRTHVAPAALRQALAKRTAPVPRPDEDEDEDDDEGEATRVAGAAELSAAIRASRDETPAVEHGQYASDRSPVSTVRPQAGPPETTTIVAKKKRAGSAAAPRRPDPEPVSEKATTPSTPARGQMVPFLVIVLALLVAAAVLLLGARG